MLKGVNLQRKSRGDCMENENEEEQNNEEEQKAEEEEE